MAWVVVAATIPAGVIGFLLEDFIAEHLGEPWQIAIFLAGFGLLLGWADRRPMTRSMDDLTLKQGVAVGFAQSLALMPGVSRSGITITAGRFLGLDRDSAARFSFLLLLPITFAAVLFKGITDVLLADLPSGMAGPFVVGRARVARKRPARDRRASRLRAPAQLRRVRDLPADRGGRDPAPDRDRRAGGDVLRPRVGEARDERDCRSSFYLT